jgi:hypothetical protein
VTVTDPAMGRRCALLCALLGAGCVGTNPRWDEPDDGDDEAAVGTSDADTDAGTTTEDASDDDEASSGIAESSWTGTDESSSGSPSADDGPVCEDGESVCAGECKDTSRDRKACGAACIDCTELYDKDATCEAGECRPDSSGPGGDDDGDDD